MALLREHFAHYRPLVAATALGAAAPSTTRPRLLDGRRQAGAIAGPARQRPDHPRPDLGADQRRAARRRSPPTGSPTPGTRSRTLWGCAAKAHGADAAYQAASELALLAGATGFTADSAPRRPAADLNALLYADGIHDSLYRCAGRSLTTPPARHLP